MALSATVGAIAPAVGVPGASITFYDGVVAIGTVGPVGGKATLTTTLTSGLHSLVARFAGGLNFGPSASAVVNITVP